MGGSKLGVYLTGKKIHTSFQQTIQQQQQQQQQQQEQQQQQQEQ